MKVTLSQIEAFHWIAALGSFHAAAERLHVAQPTISVRIRALERSIGARLFERRGRKIRVTPAGLELAERAERLLTIAREISDAGPNVGDRLRPRLRLGAPDGFALVCLPLMLQLMEKEDPALKMALTIENSAVLNHQVNAGELDIAFIANPVVGSHVRTEYLGNQDIAWVASPRLALPNRVLRPADLAKFQIFTNPEPSRLIVLVREWFAGAGCDVARVSTCNNLSVIVRLTAAVAGISLLPTGIVQSELRSGELRRLDVRPAIPKQELAAVYHLGAERPAVEKVLAITRRVLKRKRFLLP
ncbi:MAG: LysR family transcriptional regulator [Alphaproteobacteria bacterium]|nr:LysR family transcriptional regulator [Alphaproteobacteria bacterium]